MEHRYELRYGLEIVDAFLKNFYEFIDDTMAWGLPSKETKDYWNKIDGAEMKKAISGIRTTDDDPLLNIIEISEKAIRESFKDGYFIVEDFISILQKSKKEFLDAALLIKGDSYEKKALVFFAKGDFDMWDLRDFKEVFIYPVRALYYQRYLDKMMGVRKYIEFGGKKEVAKPTKSATTEEPLS